MQRAGYHVLAAIDFNAKAIATFRQLREGENFAIARRDGRVQFGLKRFKISVKNSLTVDCICGDKR